MMVTFSFWLGHLWPEIDTEFGLYNRPRDEIYGALMLDWDVPRETQPGLMTSHLSYTKEYQCCQMAKVRSY